MEGLEMICFKIIAGVGAARSCFIEAMQIARKGDYEKAEQLIQEISNSIIFSISANHIRSRL